MIDHASLVALVQDYARARGEDLGEAFVRRAQGYSSRRTGALAESIEADEPQVSDTMVTVTVRVGEEYGQWQDEGTGIYGPTGERIRPINADVLAFDWPAAGGVVFARSVRGAPGTRFWTRTREEWSSVVREAA